MDAKLLGELLRSGAARVKGGKILIAEEPRLHPDAADAFLSSLGSARPRRPDVSQCASSSPRCCC